MTATNGKMLVSEKGGGGGVLGGGESVRLSGNTGLCDSNEGKDVKRGRKGEKGGGGGVRRGRKRATVREYRPVWL